MIKEPTCCKSDTPTILNVYLSNKPRSLSWQINTDIALNGFPNITAVATSHKHAVMCQYLACITAVATSLYAQPKLLVK